MQQLAHRLERLGTETALSVAQAAAAWKVKGTRVFPFSLHSPYGPATPHLIRTGQLAAMKSPPYLVNNAARGPIDDEAALASAFREGHLAGAGLVVFENEPSLHPGLHAPIK